MKKLVLFLVMGMLLMTNCHAESEEKTVYKYKVQEMTVEYEDRQVYGKLYVPERDGKLPAIILSHGYNGGHSNFDAEGRFYASNGYLAYAFDFCGGSNGSRSSGKSTEMTIFTEKADLLAVFDHVRAMEQVDAENVYLMGGSQGGLVTALATEERADAVKAMILYFPAFNIPDDWRGKYPNVDAIPEVTDFWGLKLGREFFTSMHDFYPFQVAGSFKGDVLIITGDRDYIVSLACATRAASCYENAELIVLKGEGHGFTPAGNKTAMEKVLELMRK